VRSEVGIPLMYKSLEIDCGFRADLIVDGKLLIELKAVERLLPIHEAQVLTYLKLTGIRVGLLMNFNTASARESAAAVSGRQSRPSSLSIGTGRL